MWSSRRSVDFSLCIWSVSWPCWNPLGLCTVHHWARSGTGCRWWAPQGVRRAPRSCHIGRTNATVPSSCGCPAPPASWAPADAPLADLALDNETRPYSSAPRTRRALRSETVAWSLEWGRKDKLVSIWFLIKKILLIRCTIEQAEFVGHWKWGVVVRV